jgi:hypothetical protein
VNCSFQKLNQLCYNGYIQKLILSCNNNDCGNSSPVTDKMRQEEMKTEEKEDIWCLNKRHYTVASLINRLMTNKTSDYNYCNINKSTSFISSNDPENSSNINHDQISHINNINASTRVYNNTSSTTTTATTTTATTDNNNHNYNNTLYSVLKNSSRYSIHTIYNELKYFHHHLIYALQQK